MQIPLVPVPRVALSKSTLAEQTTPAALALTDVSKSVSAVSFGDLDLDANHVGGDVSWTPPVSDANIKTYQHRHVNFWLLNCGWPT